MKSERRHELQTNYLADHLGTAVSTSKPYATYVIGGAIVALFAALAYGFYSSQVAKAGSAAWGDYYFNIGSGDAEIFQQVAQDHSGTTAALWSKQAWADNKLLEGLDLIYIERAAAEAAVNKAIDAYQEVLSRTYESDLKNRAAMGLAQSYETIGKLDDATKYYKQVAASSQDGYAAMANSRLAWIASGEGKSFYDWFATVKSTPVTKPNIPTDLSRPPVVPDISFKDMPQAPEAKAAPAGEPSAFPTAPAATTPPATPPAATPPAPTEAAPAPAATTPPAAAEPTKTDAPAAPAAEPKSEAAPAVPPAVPPAAQTAPEQPPK